MVCLLTHPSHKVRFPCLTLFHTDVCDLGPSIQSGSDLGVFFIAGLGLPVPYGGPDTTPAPSRSGW